MKRPVPRSTSALYATSATCAAIGALLWVARPNQRSHQDLPGPFAADFTTRSAWRVWSPVVTEDRLGVYLLAAGVVLAVAARLIFVRRD
ncbi:hypothetical protein OH779_38775 [Actinacidiphila glaucinigra]|uniref:hypothetical protein n=1 Tax=Actinacidiphila glaucinigra TaxID=235986 RepID=UPI0038697AD2